MATVQLTHSHETLTLTQTQRIKLYTESIVRGDTIRALREKKKMSRSELARALDVSVQTLSLWEKGECKLSFNKFAYLLVLLANNEHSAEQIERHFFELNSLIARQLA